MLTTVDTPSPFHTLRLLLRFLRPFRGQVALSVLLGAATVAGGIGLLGTSAYLIASSALHPSVAELEVAIVGVRFFGISRAVFRYLERLVSHSVNFRLLSGLRVWFYRQLEPLAPARLQDARSADLLSRAVADIETLENFYVRAVSPPLVALVILLGVSWFAGSYDPRLALLLAGGLLAGGVGLPVLAHELASAPGRAMVERRAELNAVLLDAIQGMPDLLAFGQGEAQAGRITAASSALGRAQWRIGRAGALVNGLGVMVSGLALWGMLLLAIPLVGSGKISGIDLAVLALVTLASFEAVTPLTQAAQHLESSLQAGRRLFELVDTAARSRNQGRPHPPSPSPGRFWGRLSGWLGISRGPGEGEFLTSGADSGDSPSPGPAVFAVQERGPGGEAAPLPEGPLDLHIRGLTFTYPGRQETALADFDLDLPPGRHVALVGPSGAGKSTLFNLLLRFWEYDSGCIEINGRDLRGCDPQEVRQKMAVITQSAYLFSGTLRQNLLLARPGASAAELERAIEQAQLSGLVAQMPQGLDTWVGERGLQLSSGERQRLAIARALLRDAPLLLLDEPTANLDAASEQRMLETLRQASAGKSAIHITHRLAGLEEMHEILVLHEGRVIQRGTHAELIAAGGPYAELLKIERGILQ